MQRETSQITLMPSSESGDELSIGTMLFRKVSIGRELSSVSGSPLCMSHISFQMSSTFHMNCGATQLTQAKLWFVETHASSSFSVWWLKDKRVVAAFVMNRPDEEREIAPDWIKSSQAISPERLSDTNRSILEAAQG